jgi:hypothetical protein
MDLRDAVTLALMNQAPRRSAETALSQVLKHVRATGAGLFRLMEGRRIGLFASHGLDQEDLDRAHEAWRDASESILAGHALTEESFTLVPLGAGPEGVLYVGAADTFRLTARASDALRVLEPFLLAALEAEPDEGSPIDDYLRTTPPEQVEREQLTLVLRANGWNISGVARAMGVTRVTIYQRMQRLGIPRERPLRDDR